MKVDKLNDPLNLRDFVSAVADFIREKGPADAQPKTLIHFLSISLTGKASDPQHKDAAVTMMQKLFCGNIPYGTGKVRALAKEICSGSMDAELRENLSVIAQTISLCTMAEEFYQSLYDRINLRFFSREEQLSLGALLGEKAYPQFLLALFKHGFATLYNLPVFFADRMYEEALTCDYDSPHRYVLMRIAAENGHRDAAMEYGNYLARIGKKNADEAISYFMMALPKHSAAWSIAYLIEIGWATSQKQIAAFRTAFRVEEKLSSTEFDTCRAELEHIAYSGKDPQMAERMVYVYQVYFYLAYMDFFKAFNSMAKLLGNGTIRIDAEDGALRTEQLRSNYSRAAIKASNSHAINREGNRIRLMREEANEYDPASVEERYMRELLETASDMELMHGSYYLGNYLEYAKNHEKDPVGYNDRIRECYERAEKLDVDGTGLDGRLWLCLGRVAATEKKKEEYLEKALAADQLDAAYLLAKMEMEAYKKDDKKDDKKANLHLMKAYELLRDHPAVQSSEKYGVLAAMMFRTLEAAIAAITNDNAAAAEEPKEADAH